MASVTVYFSLPFYPVNQKTHFYNGHLAVAVDGTLFQAFNPAQLRSGFLVSAMPEREWLYGRSRKWCHKDALYRYVYLYGCGEAHRTKIYYLRFDSVDSRGTDAMVRRAGEIERAFESRELRFDIMRYNCSLFVRELLQDAFALERRWFDFVPSILFRRLVASAKRESGCAFGSIKRHGDAFRTHRYCIGVPGLNPERIMDSLLDTSDPFRGEAVMEYPFRGDNALAT